MISKEFEESGIYAMNMYNLGIPFTQIVDDRMPVFHGGVRDGKPRFAQVSKDGSFWAMIVEKMFAKLYGNWEHIDGGWTQLAVAALNGSPFDKFNHAKDDPDLIWD